MRSNTSHTGSDRHSTAGQGVDWLYCPYCDMHGHIIVRNCKTRCGNCKQIIATCADL